MEDLVGNDSKIALHLSLLFHFSGKELNTSEFQCLLLLNESNCDMVQHQYKSTELNRASQYLICLPCVVFFIFIAKINMVIRS